MKLLDLAQIKQNLEGKDLLAAIEAGFVAFSEQKAVIPAIGELVFDKPPGDVHIKYGYLLDSSFYVVKIASGFYQNPQLGLPSSNGLILVFSKKTGIIETILLDEGFLTDLRTAVAGAVVAKYMAPRKISKVGVIGTGIQAKLQVLQLKSVLKNVEVVIWGRNEQKSRQLLNDFTAEEIKASIAPSIASLAQEANLIITTTPATSPLLFADMVRPGTHITAVGADAEHKQELDPALFAKADLIVADSVAQCSVRGEIAHGIRAGSCFKDTIVELGAIINKTTSGRRTDSQTTIADLTGLAVQDIQIAKLAANFASESAYL